MPYSHLPTDHVADAELRRALNHASALLADVYTMLGAKPAPGSNGGCCNFSIALVLACVVDGLATEVWPITPVGDQYARMEALVNRFVWAERTQGWITLKEAARVLYHEIRNPLVHNLGANTRWKGRRPGFHDAAVILELRNGSRFEPAKLEALAEWNLKSPVMWAKRKDEPGKRRIVVSAPALYWCVKRAALQLATDTELLAKAVQLRKHRRVL